VCKVSFFTSRVQFNQHFMSRICPNILLPKNYIYKLYASRKKAAQNTFVLKLLVICCWNSQLGSILTTFYGQFFLYKSVLPSFSTPTNCLGIFTDCKMLVKFTTDLYVTLASVSCYLWLICEKAFSSFLFVVCTSICTSVCLFVVTSWWSIILKSI